MNDSFERMRSVAGMSCGNDAATGLIQFERDRLPFGRFSLTVIVDLPGGTSKDEVTLKLFKVQALSCRFGSAARHIGYDH